MSHVDDQGKRRWDERMSRYQKILWVQKQADDFAVEINRLRRAAARVRLEVLWHPSKPP